MLTLHSNLENNNVSLKKKFLFTGFRNRKLKYNNKFNLLLLN